jgi:hypothetical protein
MQGSDPSPLRTTMMVRERSIDVLPCSIHEPHQDADRVHEQRGVRWVMDIRLHHGAVETPALHVDDHEPIEAQQFRCASTYQLVPPMPVVVLDLTGDAHRQGSLADRTIL